MIGSFFSKASTNFSQPLILSALLAETKTSPFLSSIFSSSTDIVSPTLILSAKPMLFNSLISRTGSLFKPSTKRKTNFSVILLILPFMILPSSMLILESWLFNSFSNSCEAGLDKSLYISIN